MLRGDLKKGASLTGLRNHSAATLYRVRLFRNIKKIFIVSLIYRRYNIVFFVNNYVEIIFFLLFFFLLSNHKMALKRH